MPVPSTIGYRDRGRSSEGCETDPAQASKFQETLETLDLSDEDRVLVGLEPKNASGTAPGAPESSRPTRGTAPPPTATAPPDSTSATAVGKPASPADPVDNAATASQPKAPSPEASLPEEADPEPPAAQDPDGTPAASPDSATVTGDDKPASAADRVDNDAAPFQPKASPAGQNASADPVAKPTEKQLKYLKALIVKHPDKAKQIGIDVKSLSSISKQKASWAIKRLAPPPTSAPRSRSR